MRLKSVMPLLPPKPVSLRKNSSIEAKVSAWVMIEKYTPRMRERNARKPNTQREQRRHEQHGQRTREPEVVEGLPEPGQLLPVEKHHEVGQLAAIHALLADRAHQVHAHGVAAEREEDGLGRG